MSNLSHLSEEDQYFLARVSDAFRASDTKNCVKTVGFLDERQREMARRFAEQKHFGNYRFYGGYANASRTVLGVFPDYVDMETEPELLFPCVEAVTVRYRAVDSLSHRDFLGSLMGLNLTRESIGDILVGEGMAVLFALHPVTEIIRNELAKVGRVGVRCELGVTGPLPEERHFLEIKDTVSSLRLDCVVSVLIRQSREKAVQLIQQGLVTQNFECADSNSQAVAAGDKISVRGHGKFLVDQVGGQTRKGRIQIICKKYL